MEKSLKGILPVLCGIVMVSLLSVSCNREGNTDSIESEMAVIRPETIRAEMRFLADDLLEGRAPATRGHEIATRFMASQFEQMGLEPIRI